MTLAAQLHCTVPEAMNRATQAELDEWRAYWHMESCGNRALVEAIATLGSIVYATHGQAVDTADCRPPTIEDRLDAPPPDCDLGEVREGLGRMRLMASGK